MTSAETRFVGAAVAEVDRADVECLIERVYRDQFTAFVRVAGAIVGNHDQAFDAVQDGFARALAGAGGFRREGSLEGWVWQVVVNEARRARSRRRQVATITDQRPAGQIPEDVSWLRRVVAGMPERQRLVLFLRYYADLDYESIAAALNIASGTVAATLSQAHANLLRRLEEVGDAV
jgi:RNA polymerase sigma-70 factor (ECF subfamily)